MVASSFAGKHVPGITDVMITVTTLEVRLLMYSPEPGMVVVGIHNPGFFTSLKVRRQATQQAASGDHVPKEFRHINAYLLAW